MHLTSDDSWSRKIMPMRDTVAGDANLSECVSKMKLTLGPNWMRSPAQSGRNNLGGEERWCLGWTRRFEGGRTRWVWSHTHRHIRAQEESHRTHVLFIPRHGEQPVVVEDRVERLDPLRVDVPVADDPRLDLGRLAHHLARARRQHAVEPLASVHVHVAEQLLARHRLWVHHVLGDALPELRQRDAQHAPHGRLAAARRADHHHAHALLRRLVKLQNLLHLRPDEQTRQSDSRNSQASDNADKTLSGADSKRAGARRGR
eukprot:6196860-Pleurochrysis_carterae.AAC.1